METTSIFQTIRPYPPLVTGRSQRKKGPLTPKPSDIAKVSWLPAFKKPLCGNDCSLQVLALE